MRVFSIFFFLIGCGVHNFSFGQMRFGKSYDSMCYYRSDFNFPYDSLAENFYFFNPNQVHFNNYIKKKSYRKFSSEKSTYACGEIYELDTLTLKLLEDSSIENSLKLKYATNCVNRNHTTPVKSIDNYVLSNYFVEFDSIAKDIRWFDYNRLGENLFLFQDVLIKVKKYIYNVESNICIGKTGDLTKINSVDTGLFQYSKSLTDSFIRFILPRLHLEKPTEGYTYFFDCNYLGITDSSFKNKRIPIFSSNEAFLEIEVHEVSYDTLHYLRQLQYLDYKQIYSESKMGLKVVFDSMQLNPEYFDSLYARNLRASNGYNIPYFFENRNYFQKNLNSNYKINKFMKKGEFASTSGSEKIDFIIMATKDSEVVPSRARISFYYYEKIKPKN